MFLPIVVVAVSLLTFFRDVQSEHIRVGMLFVRTQHLLEPIFGFDSSVGAIPLALERIQRERLLPNLTFSYHFGFSQCHEATAVGELIRLIEEEHIQVLFGPPCSATAAVTGVLAKYYSLPMYSWAATSTVLGDVDRFSTVTRLVSSSLRVGRALSEVMAYFKWNRFALLYNDDNAARKCFNIAEGIRKEVGRGSGMMNVALELGVETSHITDDQIDRFLASFETSARIAIVCLDDPADIRRFMLRAHDLGLTDQRYVYLLPEVVHDDNQTAPWMSSSSSTIDGRNATDGTDEQAKQAFRSAIMLEMKMTDEDVLHYFKLEVIKSAHKWSPAQPFLEAPGVATTYGSLYSPFLHDAFYLYARTLNKMRRQGEMRLDAVNGSHITKLSRGTEFYGSSGHVFIDETAAREPNFILRGFDDQMRMTRFAEATMKNEDGQTIEMLVPLRKMWRWRGGVTPRDEPLCGFEHEKCSGSKTISRELLTILVGCAFLLLFLTAFLLTAIVIYVKRHHKEDPKSLEALWKVPYDEITFLYGKKASGSLDSGSQMTLSTNSSAIEDDVKDALAQGKKSIAYYRGILVWAKDHKTSFGVIQPETARYLKAMRDLKHDNLNDFLGLCTNGTKPMSVWKYYAKGSLEDVLHNESYPLDSFFKLSLIKDLIAGLAHLHASDIRTHGDLKSSNCLVDNSWSLKLTDFGLHKWRVHKKNAQDKLWMAPEFLREQQPPLEGSQPGDMYALGIVAQEIICRGRPFCNDHEQPENIILRVAKTEEPPFRPHFTSAQTADMDLLLLKLVDQCWAETPSERPTASNAKHRLRQITRGYKINLMDHAVRMMEKYTAGLEAQLSEQQQNIGNEMEKNDAIVYQMIPKVLADRLKSGQMVEPCEYPECSVLSAELHDSDRLFAAMSPAEAVKTLDQFYDRFNDIVAVNDAHKIENLSTGVMAVSGVPLENGAQHSAVLADVAMELVSVSAECNVKVKIGIHTGPVTAGVAGTSVPSFCLFGETTHVAVSLAEAGKPDCVHVSDKTFGLLNNTVGGYILKPRGEIAVKNHGLMFTYWLLGKTINNMAADATSAKTSSTDRHRQKLKAIKVKTSKDRLDVPNAQKSSAKNKQLKRHKHKANDEDEQINNDNVLVTVA